jgi:hypothetical protein
MRILRVFGINQAPQRGHPMVKVTLSQSAQSRFGYDLLHAFCCMPGAK